MGAIELSRPLFILVDFRALSAVICTYMRISYWDLNEFRGFRVWIFRIFGYLPGPLQLLIVILQILKLLFEENKKIEILKKLKKPRVATCIKPIHIYKIINLPKTRFREA